MQLLSYMLCVLLQASLSILQAITEQLVVTIKSRAIVPDWPLAPRTSSIKNDLLFSCLLFVTAMCRKQRDLGKVQSVMHVGCTRPSQIKANMHNIASRHWICCGMLDVLSDIAAMNEIE